jgi:ribose 5-phosphate isomerase A
MHDPYQASKRAVGRAAAELVRPGMRVGLGTGSTFVFVLERLTERMREEKLEIVGVPTSDDTARRARDVGLPLVTLDEVSTLDLTIDGADEVDPHKTLIKGGGGALVREKIVAAAAREMVVVVTANKVVDVLGSTFKLPVEVMLFGWRQAAMRIEGLGLSVTRRMRKDGAPFVSDNGNCILDCSLPAASDHRDLERTLNAIPGVVDCGLFVGMAGRVLIGDADGGVRVLR